MLVAAGLAFAGCTPIVDHRGYVVTKEAVERLSAGAATRTEVLQALGTPSTTAPFDDNTWYYFGETTQREAFYDPELVERHILILRFDEGGLLSEVGTRDAGSGREVALVSRETPTAGHSFALIEQIFGNIGRFSDPGAPQ